MPEGVGAGTPGVSVTAERTESKDDEKDGTATSTVSGQASLFGTGDASPAIGLDFNSDEIGAIQELLASLVEGSGVIRSACFMHLADDATSRAKVDPILTATCQTIVKNLVAPLPAEQLAMALEGLKKLQGTIDAVQVDIAELKDK